MLKTVKVDNYKVKLEQYNGTNALLKDLQARTMRTDGRWHAPEFSSWSGIKSREALNDLLQNGYEAPVQKLKDATKIKVSGAGKRIKFQNDIVGANPIVPLAIMGVPMNMVNMTMKPIKCKVVDIYYDMTCSCGVSASDIEDAGEKILGAILELEAQGYRFNLYSVTTYTDEHDCDMLAVKIKDSNQPFDLKRMAFPLMHPAFFRVVGFDWYSKCPISVYKSGYGHALTYDAGMQKATKLIKQVFSDNAVFFAAADIVHGKTKESIKEVLTNAKTA